jgi:hypothetical protein
MPTPTRRAGRGSLLLAWHNHGPGTSVALRYPYAQEGLGLVPPSNQLLPQRFQPPFRTLGVDPRVRMSSKFQSFVQPRSQRLRAVRLLRWPDSSTSLDCTSRPPTSPGVPARCVRRDRLWRRRRPPSSQNSGAGIAGQASGKNGPVLHSTTSADQRNPATQLQGPTKIQGKLGVKAGRRFSRPSKLQTVSPSRPG